MRRLLILLALLVLPSIASAREGWRDWCWNGAKRVTTSGLNSTTTVQATTASCTVTIYQHGGSTLATIYSDNNNTPLANPFTGSNPNGQFIWYADNGRYDQTINVTINGASNTVTMSDVLLCDPYVTGSTCNNGGSTTAHNLLSTTHLDTIPASPPTRGDVITAQNQTSPTGVNPSWARLPLGLNTYVLTSNGVDAVWAPAAGGGTGCTLPGIDTGVLSEHPAGTCYDSLHWTWDDGTTKQNMLAGDGTNASPSASFAFLFGSGNSSTGTGLCCGDFYFMRGNGNTSTLGGFLFVDGQSNTFTSVSDAYVYGEDNTLDHVGNDAVIGFDNQLIPATTNTAQNLTDTFVIGQDNLVKSITGSNGIKDSVVVGFSNQLINTNTTGGSSREMQDVFVAGAGNTLTQSSGNLLQLIHVMGTSNTITNTLADTQEVEIVGEQNTVDGSKSTLQILGFKNVAHNVSPQNTSTVNTVIVGSANTATNVGATGTNAYQGEFGDQNNIQDCTECYTFGTSNAITASCLNCYAYGETAALAGSSHVYTIGKINHLTDVTDANVAGGSNTITCDANTIGNSTCDLFMIGGTANTVTDTGAGSSAFSTHMYGRSNSLSVTGASTSSTIMLFMRSNTASAGTGGDIDDSILMGLGNDIQANGTGSITSSLFTIGENNSVHTVSGGDLEDNFILGENNSMSANAAASGGGFMTEIGFNHTIFTSTGGVQMNYGTAIGHANSNSDGSGATSTMTDFIMVGHSLHLVNCTDCFSMGKNIDQAGINNTLWLGMSASDVGLVITNSGGTHDNVRRTPMVFASLPACAAGTEGSFAAITDSSTNTWGATITGSSGSHVLGYCDGTNWTVAGK